MTTTNLSGSVHVLGASAVKGLLAAMTPKLAARRLGFAGLFAPSSQIRARVSAGEPCDLLVMALPELQALDRAGFVQSGSIAPIGRVAVGLAIRQGAPCPDMSSTAKIRANLAAAQLIYLADPEMSISGRHFRQVTQSLDLENTLASCTRVFPNGAAALAALADQDQPLTLACALVSTIRFTPGVQLVCELPAPFGLQTVYAAALARSCRLPDDARFMLDALTAANTAKLRRNAGFSPA